MSNDLRPKHGLGLWNNRLWILSAGLGAASIISAATIIHDTTRQRTALHAVVRSTAEQIVGLAGSRVEMLALEMFAPAAPWSARPVANGDSAAAVLDRVRENVARCACRDTLAATEFFRFDVARRTLARLSAGVPGGSGDAGRARVLERIALAEVSRGRARADAATHLVVARDLGEQAAITMIQFDSAGAPSIVYGALVPAREFMSVLLRSAAARTSLVDSAGRTASLRDVEFRAVGPDSATIVDTIDAAHPFRTTIRSAGPLEGIAVTAALSQEQVPVRINIASEERLHLGVLLAATILVIGFAVGSSRRELLLARARSDFIAGVSHDLRMPLAQILIAGETLTLERERDADDRRVLSHAIVREARRLVSIVDNVLLFSRSGTARPNPMVRPITIPDVFDDVVEAVGLAVDDAGQSIVAHASSLAVLGDRQLLRQALVNLVDNALKYGARDQCIELRAERAANVVRIYVDDRGPGVPAEERTRMFEPYERLFRDRTSERSGSGLGLAVVREIAVALNGRAWLDDAPAGGTRAVIELPFAPDQAATSTRAHAMT